MDFVSDGAGVEIGSAMYPSFGKYFMPELNDVYNQDVVLDQQKHQVGYITIFIGIVNRSSEHEFVDTFIDGADDMVGVILVVAIARGARIRLKVI